MSGSGLNVHTRDIAAVKAALKSAVSDLDILSFESACDTGDHGTAGVATSKGNQVRRTIADAKSIVSVLQYDFNLLDFGFTKVESKITDMVTKIQTTSQGLRA